MFYKRIHKIIIKNILKNIYNIYYFIFFKNNYKNIEIEKFEETIKFIIATKSSVSRYGDGEFNLIFGRSINFNNYDKRLQIRLKEILNSYENGHIVCIPDVFKNRSIYKGEAQYFWTKFILNNHKELKKLLNKNKKYYDSLITRPYMDYREKKISQYEKKFSKLKKIWENREILIIEGEKTRLGIGNDLFVNTKKIERILCPNTKAFDRYNEIISEVLKHSKNKLLLIALGPTATVLAYDLHKKGYQAIDIGHIDIEYEWFLKREKYKVQIKNKFVNEAINKMDIYDIKNEEYNSQIVNKII